MKKIESKYPEDLRQRAQRRVEEIKSFYIHLAIYLIFIPVFIFLNMRSTPYPWAIFPIVGWGLGVLGHAAGAFDWHPIFNKEWEKRQIRKILEEEN